MYKIFQRCILISIWVLFTLMNWINYRITLFVISLNLNCMGTKLYEICNFQHRFTALALTRDTSNSTLNCFFGFSGMRCATNKVDLADNVVENVRWGWFINAFLLFPKSIFKATVEALLFCITTEVQSALSYNIKDRKLISLLK